MMWVDMRPTQGTVTTAVVTVKYLMRRRMRYDNLLDSVGFDYVCGRASDAEPLAIPVYKGVR
tara:strand:+ start:920 stop:1105 length:186 start_codon:yes stop_codon:yes gene_type:complete